MTEKPTYEEMEKRVAALEDELVRHTNMKAQLDDRTGRLSETEVALDFLLKKREDDKMVVSENVAFHVKKLVWPYIEKLKQTSLNNDQAALVAILESNLGNIVSPFANRLSSRYLDLTPMEIRIADLVKQGKTNKEMAQVLKISVNTVRFHRSHLRDKLGLKTKKKNLRSSLLTLEK